MNRIKELRKQKNLTIADLSESLGIPKTTLNNYENEKRLPRNQDVWKKLADFFDVSIAYVMGISDDQLTIEEAKKIGDSIRWMNITAENSEQLDNLIDRINQVTNREDALTPPEKFLVDRTNRLDREFIDKYMSLSEKDKEKTRSLVSTYLTLNDAQQKKASSYLNSLWSDSLELPF